MIDMMGSHISEEGEESFTHLYSYFLTYPPLTEGHPSDDIVNPWMVAENTIENEAGEKVIDLSDGMYNLDRGEGYRNLSREETEYLANIFPIKPQGTIQVKAEQDELYLQRNGNRIDITEDEDFNFGYFFPEFEAIAGGTTRPPEDDESGVGTKVGIALLSLGILGAGVAGYSLMDSDHDGLKNYEEWTGPTSWRNPDMDGDSLEDGDDPDPLVSDIDQDGLLDGEDPNPLTHDFPVTSYADEAGLPSEAVKKLGPLNKDLTLNPNDKALIDNFSKLSDKVVTNPDVLENIESIAEDGVITDKEIDTISYLWSPSEIYRIDFKNPDGTDYSGYNTPQAWDDVELIPNDVLREKARGDWKDGNYPVPEKLVKKVEQETKNINSSDPNAALKIANKVQELTYNYNMSHDHYKYIGEEGTDQICFLNSDYHSSLLKKVFREKDIKADAWEGEVHNLAHVTTLMFDEAQEQLYVIQPTFYGAEKWENSQYSDNGPGDTHSLEYSEARSEWLDWIKGENVPEFVKTLKENIPVPADEKEVPQPHAYNPKEQLIANLANAFDQECVFATRGDPIPSMVTMTDEHANYLADHLINQGFDNDLWEEARKIKSFLKSHPVEGRFLEDFPLLIDNGTLLRVDENTFGKVYSCKYPELEEQLEDTY